MTLLDTISSPADLRALPTEKLDELAAEIREFLVEKVSATGGHLGPNLGVVELTMGIHRIFHSPEDAVIFDTSHQSYVHKIFTGRKDQFDTLRQEGGLSGYTSREESEHDWTESSHASAALSYADGLSKAWKIKGEDERQVVAVVGDGALTGGMCWEALNNIACDHERQVVIIVNDNGRSYSPTIGGFAENLARLRTAAVYDKVMEQGKTTLKALGKVGERTFEALHAMKDGVRSTVIQTEMFAELGMKYVGPVDGHNIKAVEETLAYAREYPGPIIVHMVTEKGRGYAPAENDVAELMHSTGVINPKTGEPVGTKSPGWTSVFSRTLVEAGKQRADIVAITAAMSGPTGLSAFAEAYPDRFFDVGIAEQHALTSAAGLALGGMHPVVAVYSTFLNRGFDQLLMDVGLLDLPVTIVLDRAGVTGSDGASHNGVWDLAVCAIVPGLKVAAPRDARRLQELFDSALGYDTPTVVRFPKGDLPAEMPTVRTLAHGSAVVAESTVDDDVDVLIIATGSLVAAAVKAAENLEVSGKSVRVVDPEWVLPIRADLVEAARHAKVVLTIEDGIAHGGVGSSLNEALHAADVVVPVRNLGFPALYPKHASRGALLAECGLDAAGLESQAQDLLARFTSTGD
ncbi:MAG: 1-deoxy-D-xylulose-5-phosphate synthase [Corynebacterium sp.]|nr:1-deoxy-D-xylulose-5-phosphate synthase [Corynebacterium sp.]